MKTKTFNLYLPAFLIAVVIFLNSCASSTMIVSDPPGAKLYIDGYYAGPTPYLYSDTKITGSKTHLKLVKEGYEPLNTFFTRSEEVDVGAIVGGVFVWPVFLWTMKYYPEHYYELYPLLTDDPNESTEINENSEIIAPGPDNKSRVGKLRELKQMFDEKLITEQEYQKAKEKILNEDDKK